MPGHDPNWFYSTLAQSTAALIGLAGGFLVSRLIARREEINTERQSLMGDFDSVVTNFVAQGSALLQAAERAEVALADADTWLDGQSGEPRSYFATFTHTTYVVGSPSLEEVEAARSLPDLYREAAPSFEVTRPVIAGRLLRNERMNPDVNWLDVPTDTRDPFTDTGIGPENYWSGMSLQRGVIQARWAVAARGYDDLRGRVQAFRGRLIPRSIFWLLGILGALMVAGVIAPLFFLSAESGASKTILLIAFIPLALAFVGYLVYEVIRIRQAADLSRTIF